LSQQKVVLRCIARRSAGLRTGYDFQRNKKKKEPCAAVKRSLRTFAPCAYRDAGTRKNQGTAVLHQG